MARARGSDADILAVAAILISLCLDRHNHMPWHTATTEGDTQPIEEDEEEDMLDIDEEADHRTPSMHAALGTPAFPEGWHPYLPIATKSPTSSSAPLPSLPSFRTQRSEQRAVGPSPFKMYPDTPTSRSSSTSTRSKELDSSYARVPRNRPCQRETPASFTLQPTTTTPASPPSPPSSSTPTVASTKAPIRSPFLSARELLQASGKTV